MASTAPEPPAPRARRDRSLVFTAAFLRAVATSLAGVLLGIYLGKLGIAGGAIGAISTAGLAGAALAALAITVAGDRWGRRRCLLVLTGLSAVGGAVLLTVYSPWAIGAVAFAGMVNAMGRDRGAASVLEQAMLPATTDDAGRTRAFAWYSALQDAGHALGSLAAGLPALLLRLLGPGAAAAHGAVALDRAALALYPVLLFAAALLCLGLSPAIEIRQTAGPVGAHPGGAGTPARGALSPASRRLLARIATLFAIDSVAGGFLVTTLLSWFFFARFGADPGAIAGLFAGARLANVASHFGAAWLAQRIGLVNTMVFTHIPSSLLLAAVPFVPSFPIAAALFLLRECLVEMDVPTRQSYVMAVVAPGERTAASGVTNLVRLAGWAVGPVIAGALMERWSLAAPLLVGAGLKIAYDLLLWGAFRHIRPPEERSGGRGVTRADGRPARGPSRAPR